MKAESCLNVRSEQLVPEQRASKIAHVRQVFEDAPRYLKSRSVDIRFRAECVQEFARRKHWRDMIDIGCGDGSISAPLMRRGAQITLLDCSANMLARAKSRIPDSLKETVEIVNEEFGTADLGRERFDLVVTVGVIAHVDSPDAFLGKIRDLLRPGGRLIMEFTDAAHPVGKIGRGWGRLKEMVAPPKYSTNKFSARDIAQLTEAHGFRPISVFRYSRVPLPGMDRLVSRRLHYTIAKLIFGDCANNRASSLGNEYICLLEAH